VNINTPAERLFFSTVRIETELGKGKTGTGTAFVFAVVRGDRNFLCLVSNKHVIANATVGRFFFTAATKEGTAPDIGKRVDIVHNQFDRAWHGHEDPAVDIAITPLWPIVKQLEAQNAKPFFVPITDELMPTEAQLGELDALEEVVFIGYPNGIYDTKNLLPVMRRGTTATPIHVNYDGKPIFLMDASVFPGSSGSPVLICHSGSYRSKNSLVLGSRLLFLGIVSSVFVRHDHGRIELMTIPTQQMPMARTEQMIDLGVVFNYNAVRECVESFMRKFNVQL